MTPGQGTHPDEAPAPPVSTRWSEDSTSEGDELAPPYVPDRAVEESASGPGGEPAPGPSTPTSGGEEQTFPFDQPDAGFEESDIDAVAAEPGPDGWESAPLTEPAPETLPAGPAYGEASLPGAEATPESYDAPLPDVRSEVAAELERMARLVREEGPDAVAAEMASPDRLTAILAGMVAGYLSGRR